MRIEQFAMERTQSVWENQVELNLSESGVHPLRLGELVADEAERDGLCGLALGYPQTNGTPPLRDAIAALYPGATRDHIEVTNGGAEANFISCWSLIEPGDEVVAMLPNYMQSWGLARAFAGEVNVREWRLREVAGPRWVADLDHLRSLVTSRTKLILVCNPNNPTGARLSSAELDGICRVASPHGAWVLSDEIYRGAELDGVETSSMWGRYERVIITSGLSKAYGLPGLRIGWIVAPPPLVERFWSYHDYTTIAPGAVNDRLATLALQPNRRAWILGRTRTVLRANLPVVEAWVADLGGLLSYARPEAGAIVFVRYNLAAGSTALVTALRERKSTLVVAGDQFGMDGYLRIGYGGEPHVLRAGLERIGSLLASWPR